MNQSQPLTDKVCQSVCLSNITCLLLQNERFSMILNQYFFATMNKFFSDRTALIITQRESIPWQTVVVVVVVVVISEVDVVVVSFEGESHKKLFG